MRERMDTKLRAHLLERLAHRADRLAKCARFDAPDTVLALMARHVSDTASVLIGEEYTRHVLETVFDQTADAFGVCRFCHARPLRQDKTMCQVCWDTAQSDDEMTDDELAAVIEDVADVE